MNILVIDDEPLALKNIERVIRAVLPESTVTGFTVPDPALAYAQETTIEVAFLDIEMAETNGLILAKQLKEINPATNIIFVTGYSEYAVSAFEVRASHYLLKPAAPEDIRRAMDSLRDPIKMPLEQKKIRVLTFGNFEIFANDVPLAFTRTKTKEVFAYLISREGAECSYNEIISVIWENREETAELQGYFRQLVYDLTHTLKAVDAEEVLYVRKGIMAVVPEKINCDFFRFLKGETLAVNSYRGEFMRQYSWAEFTNGYLKRATE